MLCNLFNPLVIMIIGVILDIIGIYHSRTLFVRVRHITKQYLFFGKPEDWHFEKKTEYSFSGFIIIILGLLLTATGICNM